MKIILVLFIQLIVSSLHAAEISNNNETVAGPESWVIEKIECSENKKTSCSVLENELYLHPGDKVNEQEIENGRLRMKTSGLFYDAQISLKKGSERGMVIVVIEVQERSANYVNFSGSASATSGAASTWRSSGSVAVGNRNLFGLGKRFNLSFTRPLNGSESQSFSANFEDPNLFGSSMYFGSLSYNQYSSKYDNQEFKGNFYQASFGRRIFDFSYLKVSTLRANTKTTYSDYQSYLYGPSESSYTTNSLEYGWNTKDDTFFPTSGSTFALGTSVYGDSSTYYMSNSNVKKMTESSVFEYGGSLRYDSRGEYISNDILLDLGVAKYFTFSRQGEKVPDKMKIYARINADRMADSYNKNPTIQKIYSTGISYLMDSFGEIGFNLAYTDFR